MSKKKKKDEIQSPFEDMKESKEVRHAYREYIRGQNRILNDIVAKPVDQIYMHNAKYRIMYNGKTAANLRKEQGIGNNSPLEHMPAGLLGDNISVNAITLFKIREREKEGNPMTSKEIIAEHGKSAETVMEYIQRYDLIKPSEYNVYPNVNKKGDC